MRMHRLLKTLVILALGSALACTACDKDNPENPPPEVNPEPLDLEADKKDNGMPEDPKEMARLAREEAEAMGAGEAPEELKKLVGHIQGLTAAVRENLPDCKKAAAAANEVVESAKADFDGWSAFMKKLPDSEKVKMGLHFQALAAPILQEYVQVQRQFVHKCAAEAKALAEIMKKLQG
jgi:hypothetical protein